jgi:hypothetical protein
LEASLAAVAGVEREREALAKQWQLRRERARYETERAARQYQACEPENPEVFDHVGLLVNKPPGDANSQRLHERHSSLSSASR